MSLTAEIKEAQEDQTSQDAEVPPPRWEKPEAWLVLLYVVVSLILTTSLGIGFAMYYVEWVVYFDVSKGTASLIQLVWRCTELPAGKMFIN
jgi:hypothetical protein